MKGHKGLISNFLPTPTPSHWLLLLPHKAVSFLFYNLHRLQRESTPPRLLRPSKEDWHCPPTCGAKFNKKKPTRKARIFPIPSPLSGRQPPALKAEAGAAVPSESSAWLCAGLKIIWHHGHFYIKQCFAPFSEITYRRHNTGFSIGTWKCKHFILCYNERTSQSRRCPSLSHFPSYSLGPQPMRDPSETKRPSGRIYACGFDLRKQLWLGRGENWEVILSGFDVEAHKASRMKCSGRCATSPGFQEQSLGQRTRVCDGMGHFWSSAWSHMGLSRFRAVAVNPLAPRPPGINNKLGTKGQAERGKDSAEVGA